MLALKFKFDLDPPDCETEEQHMDGVLKPRVEVYLKVYWGGLVEEGAWGLDLCLEGMEYIGRRAIWSTSMVSSSTCAMQWEAGGRAL